jgi:hypothetical protein
MLRIGPAKERSRNMEWVLAMAKSSSRVVCAWGATLHTKATSHVPSRIYYMLRSWDIPMECLGLTAADWPKHPLYLGKHLEPVPYTPSWAWR